MPILTCPTCSEPLQVPNELLGGQVRCSACQAIFTAEEPGPQPTEDQEEDRPRRRRRYEDDDDDDWGPGPRRDVLPHRGSTVLTLGIVAVVCISLCFPLALPLGIPAWVMGAHDLRLMREGVVDHRGAGSTKAGMICGIVAVSLCLLFCAFYAVFITLAVSGVFK